MSKTREVPIRVRYPVERGRLALRTELDWEADLEADGNEGDVWDFTVGVPVDQPFFYFKPVLIDGTQPHWSRGSNYLALASGNGREVFPYFHGDDHCSVCELKELKCGGGGYQYRIFYPPGYHENVLARYPVLYMHDGQNLFFPDEAFQGQHWKIRETLALLGNMNAISPVMVVGVYPDQRERDYTLPGYQAYGEFLAECLKPEIDSEYRTIPRPEWTAVMGSSLGGVASLFLAWQWPEVFGMAACLSSTFGWKDDLRERVLGEPKRPAKIYLDSGWPSDNYEVTRDMRAVLVSRGYREGSDLFYYAFPEALHNESSWAMRCHLPFQLLFGTEKTNGTKR